ncbi:MAG: pyridoxal phosphate-dependent decarboxylase family protein [Candidatus Limivicinus sp.]
MKGQEFILNTEQLENAVKDFVHDFCEDKHNIHTQPVIQEAEQPQLDKLRNMEIPKKGRPVEEVVEEMEREVYHFCGNANHPRFFGFVPGPASCVSWLGDVMTAAYNIHAGGSRLCPTVNCIEQNLIRWMADLAGFGPKAGGIFVSGGSMANITALTAARDRKLTENTLHLGVAYVSDQTHSSVAKGLRIIGITEGRLRTIPTDENFRMRTDLLEQEIKKDIENGMIPFAVIGTAGTTNTGSVDPLREIADICKKYEMWFHIDGALGGSVLLSSRHRDMLDGVELADSLSWDAHKWLFQTYGCAAVLVKNLADLEKSFSVTPEYLRDLSQDSDMINVYDIGIELTRPARGLKLWLTLQVLGTELMGSAIDQGFQLAKWAQETLESQENWEIVSPAQMAMVNFRYSPADLTEEQKDELNEKVSARLNESGYAAIFTTVLNGHVVLRLCAIHPETTKDDIQTTLQLMNKYALEIHGQMHQGDNPTGSSL